MNRIREVFFYKDFFVEFYLKLPLGVQQKYDYVFVILREHRIIPTKFLKRIKGQDGLYELRIEFQSNIYRTFCCFDMNNLIVLFNSFQ